MTFKYGDRVRYTGKSPLISITRMVGWTGTVIEWDGDLCRVRWDDTGNTQGHYEDNLEALVEAPKTHIVLSRALYDSYTKFTLDDAKAFAKDATGPDVDFVILGFVTGFEGREVVTRTTQVVEVQQ